MSTVSMSKTVLFQAIQINISTQFSCIWPIDWTLSGATTPGQVGPGSDGNERVLRIPQSSNIIGTIRLFSDISRTLDIGGGGSHPFAEKQLVYSTAQANWTILSFLRLVIYVKASLVVIVLFNSYLGGIRIESANGRGSTTVVWTHLLQCHSRGC